MTTTLTITAAEWASVQDGILWLVRESPICDDRRHYILRPSPHNPLGTRRYDVHDDVRCANPCSDTTDGARRLVHQAPVEFVAAAAPCECIGRPTYSNVGPDHDGSPDECPNCDMGRCRVELVAICDTCDGQGGYMYGGSWGGCEPCNASGIIHLGWGYAIGQPLPITSGLGRIPFGPCIEILTPHYVREWYKATPDATHDSLMQRPIYALAHYGDPESLIGKWALQVQVTP